MSYLCSSFKWYTTSPRIDLKMISMFYPKTFTHSLVLTLTDKSTEIGHKHERAIQMYNFSVLAQISWHYLCHHSLCTAPETKTVGEKGKTIVNEFNGQRYNIIIYLHMKMCLHAIPYRMCCKRTCACDIQFFELFTQNRFDPGVFLLAFGSDDTISI